MDDQRIEERKRELRTYFQVLRRAMGNQVRASMDAGIERRLLAVPEYADAQVVLAYLDFGPEVRTRGIIEAAWGVGKTVALPWCVPGTHELRWYRVTSFEGLVRSALDVEEPIPVDENELPLGTGQRMLALVPGLTFDADGYRLGYGGGFYDTFLADFDGLSVGLCRSSQLSRDLRAAGVIDPHDRPVDMVITEEGVVAVG